MLSEHELVVALRDKIAPAATMLDELSRELHNAHFHALGNPEGPTMRFRNGDIGSICVDLRVAARRIANLAVAKGLMPTEEAQQISKDY
jgi:hypothetical protein